MRTIIILFIIFLAAICSVYSQVITKPDLLRVKDQGVWKTFNRKVSVVNEEGEASVYLNSQQGDGITWIERFEFTNGIIEADIKGRDVQGNSFVGIAFRGVNDSTYDAVYFRPFNFLSEDSVKKAHCVQYISHPDNTWSYLRENFPGKYENPVDPAPDPNSFFHVKIVVEKPKVSVFVNDAKEPCLVVNELTERTGGWVGLWVGNNSEGTFKNLKIIR